jgi:hypothetical protein
VLENCQLGWEFCLPCLPAPRKVGRQPVQNLPPPTADFVTVFLRGDGGPSVLCCVCVCVFLCVLYPEAARSARSVQLSCLALGESTCVCAFPRVPAVTTKSSTGCKPTDSIANRLNGGGILDPFLATTGAVAAALCGSRQQPCVSGG